MSADPVVDADVLAWASSGAMALTGRADRPPLGPPRPLVARLRAIGRRVAEHSATLGRPVELDPLALLGERAAAERLTRAGNVTCGGRGRLLQAADGWFATSLARPDDLDLLPAWLTLPEPPVDPWAALAAAASTVDVAGLVARGRMLGLPVAALPISSGDAASELPVRTQAFGAAPVRPMAALTVVDLSGLWAGPLCGSILALAGASVVKVESTARPDAMRGGVPALFDLLNHDKRSVALDLRTADGVAALRRLLSRADVVVEAARPRALEQLGVVAEEFLTDDSGPRVWLSITGYGRAAPGRDWVAFGDDAAVGGGLVVTDSTGPCFCADAIADPASGLVAAAAALRALAAGGRWLVDVVMTEVAAHLAGATMPVDALPEPVAPPRIRPVVAAASALGADTAAVLSEVDFDGAAHS